MITHQSKTNIEPELPPMDEGWWASVLSDEEIQEPDLGESDNKTSLSSSALMVDWEKVQSVFDQIGRASCRERV